VYNIRTCPLPPAQLKRQRDYLASYDQIEECSICCCLLSPPLEKHSTMLREQEQRAILAARYRNQVNNNDSNVNFGVPLATGT
jgi:hypothetical protein